MKKSITRYVLSNRKETFAEEDLDDIYAGLNVISDGGAIGTMQPYLYSSFRLSPAGYPNLFLKPGADKATCTLSNKKDETTLCTFDKYGRIVFGEHLPVPTMLVVEKNKDKAKIYNTKVGTIPVGVNGKTQYWTMNNGAIMNNGFKGLYMDTLDVPANDVKVVCVQTTPSYVSSWNVVEDGVEPKASKYTEKDIERIIQQQAEMQKTIKQMQSEHKNTANTTNTANIDLKPYIARLDQNDALDATQNENINKLDKLLQSYDTRLKALEGKDPGVAQAQATAATKPATKPLSIDISKSDEKPAPIKNNISKYVDQPLKIISVKNKSFAIDTAGHQHGGGFIQVWGTGDNDLHRNKIWTVDKLNRIISYENRNSCIYNQNGVPTIVGIKNNLKDDDNKAKWILDDKGYIISAADNSKCLTVANLKNGDKITLQKLNTSNKQQQWTFTKAPVPAKWKIVDNKYVENKDTSTPQAKTTPSTSTAQSKTEVKAEPKQPTYDIGGFKNLVDKKFRIRTSHNEKFGVNSRGSQRGDGGDAGESRMTLWEIGENTVNHMYTVDQYGRLLLVSDKAWCIYAPRIEGSVVLTLARVSSLKVDNIGQYWKLDGEMIRCAGNTAFGFNVNGGTPAIKNGTYIILYKLSNAANERFKIDQVPDKVEVKSAVKPKLNIGQFMFRVNKVFSISTVYNPEFCVHSRNIQTGSNNGKGDANGLVTLWSKTAGNKINMEWTVDEDGRILLSNKREWCLYAPDVTKQTYITLKKVKDLRVDDLGQYWCLDNKMVKCAGNPSYGLNCEFGTPAIKNDCKLITFKLSNAPNEQFYVGDFSQTIKEKQVIIKYNGLCSEGLKFEKSNIKYADRYIINVSNFKLTIQNADTKKYIGAQSDKKTVTETATQAKGWETFTVYPANQDTVIKTYHGTYLTVDDNGILIQTNDISKVKLISFESEKSKKETKPITDQVPDLIGKPFKILNKKNNKFCIDLGGKQHGGGNIKVWTARTDILHRNQIFTFDKDKHLISWENQNSALFAGAGPIISGIAGNNDAKTNISKWIVDANGHIKPLSDQNKCLVAELKDGGALVFAQVNNATTEQQWTFQTVDMPKNYRLFGDRFLTGDNGFSKYVGKHFRILNKKDPSFCIDSGFRQRGGGEFKIYKAQPSLHVNQIWTVDSSYRIICSEYQNSIWANGGKLMIVGKSGNKDADTNICKWFLDAEGRISPMNNLNAYVTPTALANDNTLVFKNRETFLSFPTHRGLKENLGTVAGQLYEWTIQEVTLPKNYIRSKDIFVTNTNQFDSLVGKAFRLLNNNNKKYCLDSALHQNGGGNVLLWETHTGLWRNQIWTVDKDNHLINWENRNSAILCDDKPWIHGLSGNSRASKNDSKWFMDDNGCIRSKADMRKYLTVGKIENGSEAKFNTLEAFTMKRKERFADVQIENNTVSNDFIDAWTVELVDLTEDCFMNCLGYFEKIDLRDLKQFVGKDIMINTIYNPAMFVHAMNNHTKKGGDLGGNKIGLWPGNDSNHDNLHWTVDKYGRILLKKDPKWCIYTPSTTVSSTNVQLVKLDSLGRFDCGQYWELHGKQLICAANRNFGMNIKGGTDYIKNDGEIIVYKITNAENEQFGVAEYPVVGKAFYMSVNGKYIKGSKATETSTKTADKVTLEMVDKKKLTYKIKSGGKYLGTNTKSMNKTIYEFDKSPYTFTIYPSENNSYRILGAYTYLKEHNGTLQSGLFANGGTTSVKFVTTEGFRASSKPPRKSVMESFTSFFGYKPLREHFGDIDVKVTDTTKNDTTITNNSVYNAVMNNNELYNEISTNLDKANEIINRTANEILKQNQAEAAANVNQSNVAKGQKLSITNSKNVNITLSNEATTKIQLKVYAQSFNELDTNVYNKAIVADMLGMTGSLSAENKDSNTGTATADTNTTFNAETSVSTFLMECFADTNVTVTNENINKYVENNNSATNITGNTNKESQIQAYCEHLSESTKNINENIQNLQNNLSALANINQSNEFSYEEVEISGSENVNINLLNKADQEVVLEYQDFMQQVGKAAAAAESQNTTQATTDAASSTKGESSNTSSADSSLTSETTSALSVTGSSAIKTLIVVVAIIIVVIVLYKMFANRKASPEEQGYVPMNDDYGSMDMNNDFGSTGNNDFSTDFGSTGNTGNDDFSTDFGTDFGDEDGEDIVM